MQPGEMDPVLKDVERAARDWPPEQPPKPRPRRFFCCGRYCGCCPATCLFLPALTFLGYFLGLVAVLALPFVYIIFGCFFCGYGCYTRSWSWQGPGSWVGQDSYMKTLYLVYQNKLRNWKRPAATPEFMPIDKIKPKGPLDKNEIDYALDIVVPSATEAEFRTKPGTLEQMVSEHLPKVMAADDDLRPFESSENPVHYVMKILGNIYPVIRDEWFDKQSDRALTRFAFYGLGAHRLETVTENGAKYYVVKTNQLAGLPVRGKFAKYGGDAYFDAEMNPVKIVDDGFAEGRPIVSRPGDAAWNHAKFRFRSSLSVLVTLVDHLYAIHLQVSNITIMAARETLSPEHPLRRFLTPFTYGTITVNADARKNLIQPGSMAPRNFAFSNKGMSLAFAAAPRLVRSGMEVPASEGGPFLNRLDYYAYLKNTKGIDTEYTRQAARLYTIFFDFIDGYLKCYYTTDAALVSDPEMQAMFKHMMQGIELSVSQLVLDPSMTADPAKVAVLWKHAIANFMWVVTAGHEHTGAIQAFVQDPSFCAFKWLPGQNVSTKESALLQALLMSFTSQDMPMLLGSDWTYLFPPASGSGTSQRADAVVIFRRFQTQLEEMAVYCDEYNASASKRPFPECFPLTCLNPRHLETSISV